MINRQKKLSKCKGIAQKQKRERLISNLVNDSISGGRND